MVSDYCVGMKYTIKEVLDQFDCRNDRVAIVIDDEDRVVGVISQGDILRALASGIGLYANVSDIIHSSYLHLYERDMNKAYAIFKKKKITLLPVIDENNKLLDVINLDDIFTYLESK